MFARASSSEPPGQKVDWERAQWLIPAERMKAGKPHTVYLADQALDILTTLRTCFPSSSFVHPSRYDSAEPISQATLNRTIAAAVDRIDEDRTPDQEPFLPVSVHDLRRTFSSRLNDALFPEALIEACLAYQKKDQVAAAYNHVFVWAKAGRHARVGGHAGLLDAWRNCQRGHRPGQGEDRCGRARCKRHELVGQGFGHPALRGAHSLVNLGCRIEPCLQLSSVRRALSDCSTDCCRSNCEGQCRRPPKTAAQWSARRSAALAGTGPSSTALGGERHGRHLIAGQ